MLGNCVAKPIGFLDRERLSYQGDTVRVELFCWLYVSLCKCGKMLNVCCRSCVQIWKGSVTAFGVECGKNPKLFFWRICGRDILVRFNGKDLSWSSKFWGFRVGVGSF